MVPAENKAKHLSSVNHSAKIIHHHHHQQQQQQHHHFLGGILFQLNLFSSGIVVKKMHARFIYSIRNYLNDSIVVSRILRDKVNFIVYVFAT